MGGDKYTRLKDDGSVFSKLDRFLICDKFLDTWPLATITALKRRWSDRNPVTLITDHLDYGPCPFKLYNSWLLDSWSNNLFRGTLDFVLNRKLKKLKEDIRKWRRWKNEELLSEQKELDLLIQMLEDKATNVPLSSQEQQQILEAKKKLLQLENSIKLDLRQKARIKWMEDGDKNTNFFHG